MDNYAAIKSRIFENQKPYEYTILNHEDVWISGFKPECKVRYFSTDRPLEKGVWIEDGKIVASLEGEQETICSLSDVKLRGRHNLENILCAIGITGGERFGDNQAGADYLSGVKHRLQEVEL